MNQKFKFVFGAMCALFSGLWISNEALGQTLPDGKGRAEFVNSCTACHRTDMVTRLRKTPADWRTIVDDMVSRGAEGSKEDIDNIVLYLATNFGPDKSGSAAVAQSTTPSSTSPASMALSSSEIEHVKGLITENGCLTCHRIEKEGAYTGPTLNGLGSRRSTDEIRAAIVSPRPTLDPSNDLVQITTADGKRLVGRILRQDDLDVQVIDASGEVATYSKSTLRQFTIIDTDPMPSFEGKIVGEDLDGLVRYLGSLPSMDKKDKNAGN
jgi:putative heme-binding domain-containing protein